MPDLVEENEEDVVVVETWGITEQLVADFTLYSGTLGTAFLQFKAYQVTNNEVDLKLCSEIVKACDFASSQSRRDSVVGAVVNDILKNGRALGVKERCPFMFEWYGEKYWGAAHGMAGIMHVLMYAKLSPDEAEEVKCTLKYMINYRLPSGNYPSSEQDCKSDCLVHWCHGAPGMALTLIKAAEEFLEAAVNAAGVVWNRGLLKRVGICHGISGNTFVFLSLYRLTGNKEFLYRAKAFTCFLLDRAHRLISEGEMHGGDNPYSLFEGIGGMACLFLDMTQPTDSKFPAYEL
ncbi:hypothetical protein TEA_007403 [Camellia sinensis var. sinensis]|uniref:LanC-like protein GCL2 n=1 Tax=Camellia sinensis var. sinensis TaxID=542762 RepID=A0A4S4ECU7_CAMSN|nr:hypothetical protein TEA_007403 [Camellia sinensis var. sinensis]